MKKVTYLTQEPITIGWSHDLKFKASSENEVHFLRLNPIKQLQEEQQRFNTMKQIFYKGFPIQEPLSFEVHDDTIIQTFRWIEGESCEDIILHFDEKDQYQLGVQAGRILKAIHGISAQADEDVAHKLRIKAEKKVTSYLNCGIKLKYEKHFIQWLNEGLDMLHSLPSSFQHGDYHVGNMIIKDKQLFVIDFNRSSDGDPWQDFDRIHFSARVSPSFARGQVEGYFDGQPPKAFYQRLKFYCALNTISSIPWALNYSMEDVQVMQNIAEDIASWYQDDDWIPSWMK